MRRSIARLAVRAYDFPSMRWVANLLYLLAGFIYLPFALYQAIFLKKNRSGWGHRFGNVPARESGRKRIWIHAVSLGEVNATPTLVAALKERHPDAEFVFSTTTDTGYARAVQHYGADRVFRFPLDFSLVIARVLDRVRPSMIVLVELELWYNLVRMATARGIPVAVVNGRLTERSHRRMKHVGALVRPMFADVRWVGAQDEVIADRFVSLGIPRERVEVTGSVKWDTAMIADRIEGADALAGAIALPSRCAMLVCGSTGPGEEEIVLDAYVDLLAAKFERVPWAATIRLAIVPRKPERFDEVAKLIESRGWRCLRRSQSPDGSAAATDEERTIVLGDTMGELRKFYSLATVVFVGRSLVALGGSDPMEVAALAKPILIGPHFENFELPVRALEAAGALRVVRSRLELTQAAGEFVDDLQLAAKTGYEARRVVQANQGATSRTANRLAELLVPALQTPLGGKLHRNSAAALAD